MSSTLSKHLLALLIEGEKAFQGGDTIAMRRTEAALWQEYERSSPQEQQRLPILDILEYLGLLEAKAHGKSAMTEHDLTLYRESLIQDLSL